MLLGGFAAEAAERQGFLDVFFVFSGRFSFDRLRETLMTFTGSFCLMDSTEGRLNSREGIFDRQC